MKSKVDTVDIGKLETTPTDLSKLSDVVENEVIKKTEYNELVKKLVILIILIILVVIYFKKLTRTQKLMKLKRKLLIMIMLNIWLLRNSIS